MMLFAYVGVVALFVLLVAGLSAGLAAHCYDDTAFPWEDDRVSD